jgi:hypothetical protein
MAGCGGGGSGHSGPLPGAGSGSPTSPNGAKQAVTVKIVIPKGKHSKIAVRRPHYVSSATTQLVIDVQTGCPSSCSSISGFPETVPLTPTSTGCSSTLASTECQLTLQLSPGSYTGTLTTEDAQNRALSTAQNVALDVVAGTSNSLSATLSGIPLSIVASVLSATANTILVQALDADNNSITGPGSPTFSVTRANGIAVGLVQPTSTSPNTFTAVPAATGNATLDVAASYPSGTTNACTSAGAVCSSTLSLSSSSPVSDLFVANSGNNTVEEFAAPYTGTPTTLISTGLSAPAAIAFNSVGNMFVANSVSYSLNGANSAEGSILEYAPPYTGAPLATIPTLNDLFLAFDASDDLFAAGHGRLLEVAPPYTGTPTTLFGPSSQVETPAGIVLDSAGNLYVPDSSSGFVSEYAPPYTGSPTAITPAGSSLQEPAGAALDSSGDLFVADYVNESTGEAEVVEFASPFTGAQKVQIFGNDSGLNGPIQPAFDPAGKLYVTNYLDNAIAIYTPPFTSSTVPTNGITTSLNAPTGLAFHTTYSIALK